MEKKSYRLELMNDCVNFVKYYPIVIHVIIAFHIFDHWFNTSTTDLLYPLIGHSVAFDILLLKFSKAFRLCAWNRTLIYSLLFNIAVEWIYVNIDVPLSYDVAIYGVTFVTCVFLLAAIYLRFKHREDD